MEIANNVVPDIERYRRTAIFVMQNFVPDEQRRKVDLEFIMQQLSRSPILQHVDFPTYYITRESSGVGNINMYEHSQDWEDLMCWRNQSLLDTVEAHPVHLFQWEQTYKYLVELMSGLKGTIAASPRLDMQRKEIFKFIHSLRESRNKERMRGETMMKSNVRNKPMNVCWIIWKLRGMLATIPTPNTKVDSQIVHFKLSKFHEDLGILSFPRLNQWIIKNPEPYLLYLAAACWFPDTPLRPKIEAQDLT